MKYYLIEKDTEMIKSISDGKIDFNKERFYLVGKETKNSDLFKMKNGNISFLKDGKLSFEKIKYKK